ncbi:unnamed protein product [Nezara viridula]|uniref:Uncharacterized protein n=1 Tax=Nezara viridula TaxID=85310 RepID=A0A9P0E9E6_NEZVI|nr:unnamed protein product [Nezara viridula]
MPGFFTYRKILPRNCRKLRLL